MKNIKKVIITGDSGIGKTCVIHKLINDSFLENRRSTIAFDIKNLEIKIKDKICNLQLWDTAGQEEFKHLNKNFFKDANVIIFAFSLTNLNSFNNIDSWINLAKEVIEINKDNTIIIGTKSDLISEREVKQELIEEYCNKNNIIYLEFSSKNNNSESLKNKITNIIQNNDDDSELKNSFVIEKESNEEKKGCC